MFVNWVNKKVAKAPLKQILSDSGKNNNTIIVLTTQPNLMTNYGASAGGDNPNVLYQTAQVKIKEEDNTFLTPNNGVHSEAAEISKGVNPCTLQFMREIDLNFNLSDWTYIDRDYGIPTAATERSVPTKADKDSEARRDTM